RCLWSLVSGATILVPGYAWYGRGWRRHPPPRPPPLTGPPDGQRRQHGRQHEGREEINRTRPGVWQESEREVGKERERQVEREALPDRIGSRLSFLIVRVASVDERDHRGVDGVAEVLQHPVLGRRPARERATRDAPSASPTPT